MIFYSYFAGQGRHVLAHVLGPDPFGLPPEEIVERVLTAGYTPVVDHPQSERFHTPGIVHKVEREDQVYLVSISSADEIIVIQEVRADPYGHD